MAKQILSCDWGTSAFRLRLLQVDNGRILNEVALEKGIASTYDEWLQTHQPESERTGFYKSLLQSIINKHITNIAASVPIIISGMASSSIGIQELAYAKIPFNLTAGDLKTARLDADEKCSHEILLVSGLQTENDVMRGEETMLLGCDLNDHENALVVFPGTHSKHVTIRQNVVTGFETYMTGELFDLLAFKTVLSKSVIKNMHIDKHSFGEGVKDGASNNLLNSAFHVRTNQLFKKFSAEANYHYLSGLLIGHELKEIASANKSIHLVSSKNLSENYLTAIKILNRNISVNHQNADEALIRAHCKLSFLLNL